MATVSEIPFGRRGRRTLKGVREYTRVFQVVLSDSELKKGPKFIRNLSEIPQIGDSYEGPGGDLDINAFCNSVEPEQTSNVVDWLVTVTYSTKTGNQDPTANSGSDGGGGGGGGGGGSSDPAFPPNQPPKIRFGYKRVSVPVETLDGTPICNSAGQPYMPPPERDAALSTMTITKAVTDYDPIINQLYFDAINDAQWTVFGKTFLAKRVKCCGITADLQWHGTLTYYDMVAEFELSDKDWKIKILDYGTVESDVKMAVDGVTVGSGGTASFTERPKLKAIRDDYDGTPIGSEMLLDGNGKRLGKDGAGNWAPVAYREFDVFSPLDFNQLLNL